jgi:hypothetical protein
MNDSQLALRRSQLYRFLADAFLYPTENWLCDVPLLEPALDELNLGHYQLCGSAIDLAELQAEHRRVPGLTGLLIRNRVRPAARISPEPEMADIAGFYRAFGFENGGLIRERPDYLSTELEFMHTLTLKEVYAREAGEQEHLEVCVDAQRKFLQDHLACWLPLFAKRLTQAAVDGVYAELTNLATAFVAADAVGWTPDRNRFALPEIKATPFNPDFSCGDCPAAELAKEISL